MSTGRRWSSNQAKDWIFSEDQTRPTVAGVETLSGQIREDMVDRMIELYCDWRTECGAVEAAYECFLEASGPDRADAFAAYIAALDQEQSACEFYAKQVRLIGSHLAGAVGWPTS